MKASRILPMVGPGLLVAATGVGAGDLATGSLAGAHLGVAIAWAALLGGFVKFCLSEGLTRWQLATGTTLLEGVAERFGRVVLAIFLAYFLVWTFLVAAALMSACGAAALALVPISDPLTDKIVYGILHSLAGIALVRWGGYRLFERVMRLCIAFMFVTVMVTAVLLTDDLGAIARGLVIPTVPQADAGGIEWTVALLGGVGGTVTVLCYGYWIREEGRNDTGDLRVCRIDLFVGYLVTALFGVAMVIIGSTLPVEGRGVGVIVALGDALESQLGAVGRWAFLLGAWGAIASSLLGVWQSVPYLFTDISRLLRRSGEKVDTESRTYRLFLYAMATVPVLGLWVGFARMQKLYAILGAAFLPMLALTLVVLAGRKEAIGERFRNRFLTQATLSATLLFFLVFLWFVVF